MEEWVRWRCMQGHGFHIARCSDGFILFLFRWLSVSESQRDSGSKPRLASLRASLGKIPTNDEP
jgi:hypothetical protein